MSIAPKCTCHKSSNGICNSSIKECTQIVRPTPDTQLPAECFEEILLSAQAFANGMCPDETKQGERQRSYIAKIYETGALSQISKLHQAQQMLFRLASLVNADQKPDEKFLTEIKTFLDGTK